MCGWQTLNGFPSIFLLQSAVDKENRVAVKQKALPVLVTKVRHLTQLHALRD